MLVKVGICFTLQLNNLCEVRFCRIYCMLNGKQASVLLSEVKSVVEIQIWNILNMFIQNEQKWIRMEKPQKKYTWQLLPQWSIYKPINKFQMNIHKMLVPCLFFYWPRIINSLQIVPEIVSNSDYKWHHAVFVCKRAEVEMSGRWWWGIEARR